MQFFALCQGGPTFSFHAPIFFTLNLDAPHQASISFQFFKTRACNIGEEQKKGSSLLALRQWCTQDLAKGGHNRGSGGENPSRQRIFTVFI